MHYNELKISGDMQHADFVLRGMEDAAKASNDHGRAKIIDRKWLAVYVNAAGEFAYNWQGGYPVNIVSRAVALSVLARA